MLPNAFAAIRRSALFVGLLVLASMTLACGQTTTPAEETASTATVAPPPPAGPPQDVWWQALQDLCGQAFAGRLVSADEADADLAGEAMVMHVRRCTPERIEIPFHVGENRSRTWVLTRGGDSIELRHVHRHEDGSLDAVTGYGGPTTAAGTPTEQHFPADAVTKTLFEANELQASVANVWTMELDAGARFSYILRRPQRFFRADFDLRQAVEPPPAPWGEEG